MVSREAREGIVVAHGRRVVTPDGYVWFVRRRLDLGQPRRPWRVELRRLGLDDTPRRVWHVRGWRRSGRLTAELTAAILDGRIDRRGVILRCQVVAGQAQATAVAARTIARR
jgi:hypothetical protein